MTSAEASAECLQWVEDRLQDTLRCNIEDELTAQQHFVINEMLMGEDARYRVLFAYYAEPVVTPAKAKKTVSTSGPCTSMENNSGNFNGAANGQSALHVPSRRTTVGAKDAVSGLNRSHPASDNDDDPAAAAGGAAATPQVRGRNSVTSFQAFAADAGGAAAPPPPPQLQVIAGFPELATRGGLPGVCSDVVFFARLEADKPLLRETLENYVMWGTLRGTHLLDSFLRTVQHIIMPTFLHNSWPTSIQKDVHTALHRFMATVVEDVNGLKGRTVLYVPSDLAGIASSQAHTDHELVQRYEATVIHWTRQIRTVVSERDTTAGDEDSAGPLEELQYWRARARDLGNIRTQLNREEVASVVRVLKEAKSLYYLEPFLSLRSDIERGTEEAYDNLRYLSTLNEPCERLAKAKLNEIPRVVQDVLKRIQLIFIFSKFYKKERIIRLLRMVSSEIISRCSSKINVRAVFAGDVKDSMKALEDSMVAGEAWLTECRRMLAATRRRLRVERGEKVEFDESFLNEMDGFVRHRCQNLKEICLSQLQFGFSAGADGEAVRSSSVARADTNTTSLRHISRRTKTSGFGRELIAAGAPLSVPELDVVIRSPAELFEGRLPIFRGNKGPELESQLMDIQRAFKAKMEVLQHFTYNVLDVKSTQWVDDYRALKADVENLSVMMRQIITAAFDAVATVSMGAEVIEAFTLISKSEELLMQLDRNTDRVFRLFGQHLKAVQGDMQRFFGRSPPLFYRHPPLAGQAAWALFRLAFLSSEQASLHRCYALPNSPDKDEALQQYDRLDRIFREYVRKAYNEWIAAIPAKPAEMLDDCLLLQRPGTGTDVEHPPLYDVNFPMDLLLLFAEARCWQRMGEPVPAEVVEISTREERLRLFRENVSIAVRLHNAAVYSLSKEELRLFALRIETMDSKFQPGLGKLLWNSQGIVEYFVRECRLQADQVQTVIDDFKFCGTFIVYHCNLIADTLAVLVEKKVIYTPAAFAAKQKSYRAAVIQKVSKIYKLMVQKLYNVFQHFREDYSVSHTVRAEWHDYVERVELKLEEALRTMVKRSLLTVERVLPQESSMDRLDEKVFRLNVMISVAADHKPVIHASPSVAELSQEVNDVCKAIIGVVRDLPRLEDSLEQRIREETEEYLTEHNATAVHYAHPKSGSPMTLRGSYYEYMTGDQDTILTLGRIQDSFISIAEKVRDKLNQTWQLHQSSSTDNLWTTQRQDRRIKQGWKLEDYRINMDHVAQRREGIEKQEVFAEVLFLQLDFTKMKETFRAQCQFVIQHYHSLLYAEARQELDNTYDSFKFTTETLSREPKTLDQLGEQVRQCTIALDALPSVEGQFDMLAQKFALITSEAYNFGGVDPADVARCEALPEAFEAYAVQLKAIRKQLDVYKEQFRVEVEADLRALASKSFTLYQQVRDEAPTMWSLKTAEALAQLDALQRKAVALRNLEKSLQQGIDIFGLEHPPLDDLVKAETRLRLLRRVWMLVRDWRTHTHSWKHTYFMKLSSERMLEDIESTRREVMQLRKDMEQLDVWQQLKEDIELIKRILPIIDDLRTPAIRPRHWEQLKVQLDTEFDLDDEKSFCLQRLMDAHVESQAEFISNMAVAAREELKIETDLEKISLFWEEAVLIIEPYLGYHKIAAVEDINTALAEHLMMLSSMKMSRFVDNFRPRVVQWEQLLSQVADTIEGLLGVQTKWMYLESIFVGSEDIKRKLVAESKKFDSIHGQWLAIIARLITDPNVVRSTRRDSLLEQLNSMNGDLELIQRSLEGFLEDRRRCFPRFYFLSNDDLLEILGHAKEPEKVQPHLRKCFEGLYRLALRTNRNNRVFAEGMSAADGEEVSFDPPLQIDGIPVETWLRRVEGKMRETVQSCLNTTLADLQASVYIPRRPINRDKLRQWVEKHEGQALITAACMNWTHQTEAAIVEYGDLHHNGLSLVRRKTSPLYKVYKKWKSLIRKYCQMVREPQSRLQRNKLVSLVTIEVHSRDILRHLLAHRVYQLDDFEWSRQLRFYPELPSNTDNSTTTAASAAAAAAAGATEDHRAGDQGGLPGSAASHAGGAGGSGDAASAATAACLVRQASAQVRYDYEYLGNSGRLVVTGLTDRAYMTLTTALQLCRGGLPQGPAGTGKTETVKDLGKAIGKYVMVFNCSDGLDYRSVGRMLSGIAQTGAWSCFDEFNRIEVEVLSVVAQQILSILNAVSESKEHFLFEGTEIPLNVNCGLFVTMNPGYAGRSELPDNLKALLRPISMMVPDFTLICEITLLSEGFEESESLSKKVSILYELMEKQLSKQDHYDFSLRNIKAVLVQAGNLKRENFPGTEQQLCLKAMKDMNLPKFVKEDVPLFLSMLGDLFPGVTPQSAGLEELRAATVDELQTGMLQVNEHIITKCLHLWDTLHTRHGVMVVGRAASGKTVTWRTLAGSLKRLKEAGVEGPYEVVKESLLNPKSVTMDELYGSYNQATREWKDGILSDLMRQICRDATDPSYKWLVFDGPVDTLWIESMNTVLDDNKMLTLNSGERINMNPTVRMLFEVQDLSQASPATVSRCGMVYFSVEDLTWRPFISTWLQSRRVFEVAMNAPKPDATLGELQSFIDNALARALEFKRAECADLITTTEFNTVRSFTTMLDALANTEAAAVLPGGARYQAAQAGENYLAQLRMMATFSLVWSVGGSLTADSRRKLDAFVREMDSSFPSTETVFEYFPDLSTLRWVGWAEHPEVLKPFAPPEGTPYYAQIVPTVDTVRYAYMVSQLVRSRVQLVLVGTTGTGKSLVAHKVMHDLPQDAFVTTHLHFSAQTTARNVQEIIEGRMEHTSKKVCNPPGGRRMVCLIEDLNMPAKEIFGAQPPLELLRQWMDNGYWYDRTSRSKRLVNDMQLLCCMTYGRPDITERLLSKLNVFNIAFPAETVLVSIFSSILGHRFAPYADLKGYVDAIVRATIEVYMKVSTDLLPIPSKSHYLFSLRDLSKVFQGIYGCYLEALTSKEQLVALWVHESQRVFADRMNDPADKVWFKQLLNERLNNSFQTKWANMLKARSSHLKNQTVSENENPIFVDFLDGEQDEMAKYKLVPSLEQLRQIVEEGLANYNAEPGARPMNIVFFADALEHLCRIHRVLRQPQGNALLVGLGGSGRNSLSRLATYLAGYTMFTIEIHKKYDQDRFHDDLRTLYRACGVKRQQKVFYIADTQLVETSFLEDLNNMLSAGEVPNLFVKDDVQQINDDVRKLALLNGCRDTSDELYNFFIRQARQHLHLVIAMSPAHRLFYVRLRQFPALVSCTSIDWYYAWPNEALKEVGLRHLRDSRREEESDALLETISDLFVYLHDTTNQRAEQMREQIHRHTYVTPSSFIDLVRGFRTMLQSKKVSITEQRDKLANGMSKLEETKVTVSEMREELKVQDARLQEKSAEVSKATESIQARQHIAEEQQTLVASEKVKIEQTKRAALVDLAEAQNDLDRAMPTLLEAQAALDKLDKSDINEVKSYKTPAAMIRTVMEAVQTALHRKLDWDEAKKSLSEPKFIDMLKTYHESHDMTDQKLLNALEKYVKRNDFTPAAASAVSKAAGGLCQWVIAIYKYGNIYKEVHPKIVKNENAQQKVRAQEEMLRQKEEKLQKIMDEVKQLETDLQANIAEKNRLMAEARATQDKLNKAEIIVDGLEGERGRWTQSIARFDAALENINGDTLLACAFMCYCGAFTADYRQMLWLSWLKEVKRVQLPLNRDYDFVDFLADPTEVRDWQQAGLPGDEFSKENGAMVVYGPRYPLMIDPQQQAIKWVKRMERDNGLKVIDPKQPDFQKTVEYAIQFGCPLLLQDVLEEIDPLLDPIMSRSFIMKGTRKLVKVGDNFVEFKEGFKLYITTRLPNPHYTPETCTKVCLLNFAVKEQGLEEQLLKIVVEKEKPELEHENEQLILHTAAAKKDMKQLEEDILDLLSISQVSLLENQRLIETLQTAKVTAANIQTQLQEAEITSVKIREAREEYRECARRASILFFVLADLGAIDSMYQFALDSYIQLFQTSIRRSSEKIVSHTMDERIKTLNEWHTAAVYNNTCRGLFEQHKLLFAFHMTMRILQAQGHVNLEEYVFMMRGGQIVDKQSRVPNPATGWLSERAWDHILELDRLSAFHGIAAHFEQHAEEWKKWYLLERPEESTLPEEWEARCGKNALQRMIFTRCLRPDRLVFMVYEFIEEKLGSQFVDPPAFNLKDTYDESTNTIPLIFVLSTGVDPTTQLQVLAQRESRQLKVLALGQGQGDNAKRALQEYSQTGGWVFLANCHLMVSWLVELEKIIDVICEQNPHRDFRLWLSSVPTPQFPIGVLQRSIKMTTEPPKGIKANMQRLYNTFSEDDLANRSAEHPLIYRNLLFSLCFFHSVLLERRKYGTLGYNVLYDFTSSDFEVSENIIQLYIDHMHSDAVEDVPFVTIRYLIAEASYGGRVTDDWDRRVLNTYMAQYMCPEVISQDRYPLASAEEYYIPDDCNTLQAYKNHCAQLPITDPPEAFGQHANADIASRIAESTALLDSLINVNTTLVRDGGGGGGGGGATQVVTQEQRCLEILASIEEPSKAATPGLLDYAAIYEYTEGDRENALNTCLLQEVQRYNVLLQKIHRQKAELRRAVKGEIVMSEELETIFNALLLGRVPPPWMSAYPSLKPLASWAVDLVERIDQMRLWSQRTPTVFWLSGFTYPTGFLKSLQQQQARRDQISIDQYDWEYAILPSEERAIAHRPKKGAYVRGIFLEGAGWSADANTLCEPRPMELIVAMPVIHFKPKLRTGKPKPVSVYECPLYMYPVRTGMRERPSYVVAVDLDSGDAVPETYTKRGTALLLSTDE
ncbi:putative dynein heavy chain [Leptomonas pyrrhocoris]|uniref:Putative dynein heavy chain n=1 Tax=Leptomonas pyrrhocoris TaxID=157538 RepID=A0A0N0DY83_LEPPY|nr:putative dynein heavy chain [Leptomonas pyrrhocoris]XP_015662287.1 putative dynein heavy chain [Leptomonas pyrrhocoris]KPA83847.1 putative dynein heavy chain [Leptomonas pyrrhocoris]KPA83848.1 putative dynein heavy chain [Leptomonas pyrrhocoris]|eukprot:XP_015662286.1 putative dynein heavy chain [Leptomonas pyrrhocoris]